MPTIITINGASRSGKDVFTNLLHTEYNFTHIHPLSNLYSFLEEHFELPKDSIMCGEGKSFICNGGEVSLGEALVSFYHFTKDKKIGNWSYTYVKKQLHNNLSHNNSIVFSGLRNHHEAELIINSLIKFKSTRLISVWIDRPGFSGFSSDNDQFSIYNRLSTVSTINKVISNSSNLDTYLTTLNNFIKECKING